MEVLFPLAIDIETIAVLCRSCRLPPPIFCSAFGLGERVMVRAGKCVCGTEMNLEGLLAFQDERVIRETLALLGYGVLHGRAS